MTKRLFILNLQLFCWRETLDAVTQPSKKPPPELKLVAIPQKLHKKLKTLAVSRDTTIQQVCTAALEQYLEAR